MTVISGDFHVGMGNKLDESKAEKLGSGGFVDLPANMNHYASMGSETRCADSTRKAHLRSPTSTRQMILANPSEKIALAQSTIMMLGRTLPMVPTSGCGSDC